MGNQTGVARPGSSRGVCERGDGFLNTRGRTSAPCPEQLPGWRCSNEPLRKEGAGRRGPGARLGPGLGFALLSPWCPVVPRGRRRGSVQTALRVAVGESGPHPAPPTPAASPQAWQPLGVTLRARARGAGGVLVTGIHANRPAAAGPGFGNPSSLRRLRPFWQFKVTRLLRVCDFNVNSARGWAQPSCKHLAPSSSLPTLPRPPQV